MTPGLWIAPFSCDKHSQVARKHADWILRSCNGTPVNSANCGIQILSFYLTLLQSLYPYVCMYVCMYTSMHVYMIVIIDWVWYHV